MIDRYEKMSVFSPTYLSIPIYPYLSLSVYVVTLSSINAIWTIIIIVIKLITIINYFILLITLLHDLSYIKRLELNLTFMALVHVTLPLPIMIFHASSVRKFWNLNRISKKKKHFMCDRSGIKDHYSGYIVVMSLARLLYARGLLGGAKRLWVGVRSNFSKFLILW